jgi:hypothetical protein
MQSCVLRLKQIMRLKYSGRASIIFTSRISRHRISSFGVPQVDDGYPRTIRTSIGNHGGLEPRTIFLKGRELAASDPHCR